MNLKLVYRWNDVMKSFVFADEQQAIRTDQLHRALFQSITWEVLKASLHHDDFWFLVSMHHDFNVEQLTIEPTGEVEWDFLDQDLYSGGIYPAFLIYSMEDVIPPDILEQFGTDEIITDYGSYHQIKPEKLVLMISALTVRGFEVAPAGDLIFDDFPKD